MVSSFFRKKKKSAQTRAAADAAAAVAQSSKPILVEDANASATVATSDTGDASASDAHATPAHGHAQPSRAQPKIAKASSFPGKRRNFLTGSLRGSRSSVSRLPAVQEETPVAKTTALASQAYTPPAGDDDDEGGTPRTVPSTTPDLLDSLSFDEQTNDDGVEILTVEAKETVKRQLFQNATPPRGSSVASVEVSPEGLVSQMSKDEDADILIGTNSTLPSSSSSSPHRAASTRTTREPRDPTPAVPRPKSSPQFIRTNADAGATPPARQTGSIIGKEEQKTSRHHEQGARTQAKDQDSLSTSSETPLASTPTVSLPRDRPSLVRPLAMQPAQTNEHSRIASIPNSILRAEEEEDTLEETLGETVADTLTDTRATDWSRGHADEEDGGGGGMVEKRLKQAAESFVNSLACAPDRVDQFTNTPLGGAVSMFYDASCAAHDDGTEENPRRPYYNEDFCRRFVDRMLTHGMSLLALQPPNTTSNPTDDWKGRTVVMKIVPGTTGNQEAIQPKLQWITMPGGTVTKAYLTAIPLLRIHSVLTATQNMVPEDSLPEDMGDEDLCFVSITSASGRVYVFEANSVRERDEIANGLRNVIARLSFHLVAGDHQASTELYNDDRVAEEVDRDPGDLPALANPRLNMNRMTHLLLEA